MQTNNRGEIILSHDLQELSEVIMELKGTVERLRTQNIARGLKKPDGKAFPRALRQLGGIVGKLDHWIIRK